MLVIFYFLGGQFVFYEQELSFLKEHKDIVVSKWINSLSDDYPEVDSFNHLIADLFFEFMIDFHIPPESHPIIKLIPEWKETIFLDKKKLSSSVHSLNVWRTAFSNVFLEYDNLKRALECIEILTIRHGVYMEKFFDEFLQKSLTLIREKDVKIDKLHEDRLNLIGRMASSMAHEIRNPLTSIAGFLKLIRQNIVNRSQPQLLKYIDVIDDEFDSINMHITGFLSFSRNKAFEEKKIEISIMELINSTLFLLIPRLTSENIHFTINEGENFIIHAQKVSIQQVLSNIISNAIDALMTIKHQRELKIFYNEDDEFTYIHITNNGSEISEDIKNSLFEPFMTDKENGTGLGLAICKEIMTTNNGEINFKSNDEETSFTLSFSKQTIMF
jgi:two-component system, sporulation sensor kinase D